MEMPHGIYRYVTLGIHSIQHFQLVFCQTLAWSSAQEDLSLDQTVLICSAAMKKKAWQNLSVSQMFSCTSRGS